MPPNYFINRWIIKIRRYALQHNFIPVLRGQLKGYLWTTKSSYEYLLGNYEDAETVKTFISWFKANSVFYDIGANVGYHTLLANQVITAGKIYSFEPLPVLQDIFTKHLSLNYKLINNNIQLLPIGVSDKEKDVLFSNIISNTDGNTYVQQSPTFIESKNKILIHCISIDEMVANGFPSPDIIKIDVEGAEFDVLNGAIHTLQKNMPKILLATHDCHLLGVKDKCISFLQKFGYNLKHTGNYNKQLKGLDDYMAVHPENK